MSGGPTEIRGFVINGFMDGIWLHAGTGLVVAGNRIGTNAAGAAAVPNLYGVKVNVAGVTIGGTADTSPATCAGDCNVISGNSGAEVWFASNGGGSVIGLKWAKILDEMEDGRSITIVSSGRFAATLVSPEEFDRLRALARTVSWFATAGLDLAVADEVAIATFVREYGTRTAAERDTGAAAG